MKKRDKKWVPVDFHGRNGKSTLEQVREFRTQCENPKFVAACLAEFQAWRKGEGIYEFHEDPLKNAPDPLCPKALTIVEEAAIKFLNAL